MTDLLMRGTDFDAFLLEASEKSQNLVSVDEIGVITPLYAQTPIKTNAEGEFMFLVRASDGQVGEFARLQSITNMGNYDSVFNSPSKLEDYKRIYPYDVPRSYVDENGNTQEYYMPKHIGVFA